MKKHTQILTILLILQIGLTAIVFWPRTDASPESGEALLADVSIEAIQEVRVEDGEGNEIVLAKVGGEWVLASVDDFPVYELRVTELLGKLAAIRTDRLITTTESSHRRLKVAEDDFERKIVLASEGDEIVTLYVGSSPSYGSAHVRLGGEDDTYLTSELAAYQANADASSWIDTSLISVPSEDILAMRLKNANGEWEFEKDEEGNWVLLGLAEGEMTNTNAVTSLESRISSLSMTEPLGLQMQTEYGFNEPAAVLAIETEEKTITLRVGAHDSEGGTYVVVSSESPYYVRVTDFTVEGLVQNTREDFVELIPTATPTVEEAEPTPAATPALEGAEPTPEATAAE